MGGLFFDYDYIMVVAFSLMVHTKEDERVAFQEAESLEKAGCDVRIFSVYALEMSRDDKMKWLEDELVSVLPDVVICDAPLSVKVAKRVRRVLREKGRNVKVVYDITEWYPSKKNLRNLSLVSAMCKMIVLSVLSLGAGFWSDAFIFGEYYKSFPFRFLFPWKKKLFLSYYASVDKVRRFPVKKTLQDECVLYYSGNMTAEKGFFRVLDVVDVVARKKTETQFTLRIVSSSSDFKIPDLPENVKVELISWQPFEEFCDTVGQADIFFDLRDDDVENTRCLPIKLFYYMSAGRPVIYTALKAIPKGVPEIDNVGCLVPKGEANLAANFVLRYIEDASLYQMHCRNGIELCENKYNWEMQEAGFVNFIKMNIG